MKTVVVLAVAALLAWAFPSRGSAKDTDNVDAAPVVGTYQSILRKEMRFGVYDKVDLAPAESCPYWMGIGPSEGHCRRLTVIYRGVYLSGFLAEHTIKTEALTIYYVGHEAGEARKAKPTSALRTATLKLVNGDAAAFVHQLFDQGNDVLIVFMPGNGLEPASYESLKVFKTFKMLINHGYFSLLDGPGDSAATYFVAHVKAFLDNFAAQYEKIVMVGRSGGGWATTFAAAIDVRIQCSISFFGTLPLRLRAPSDDDKRDDLGDFEQHALSLFRFLDYTDLYALAAYGGRRHAQVYNFKDDCCFSGHTKGALVKSHFDETYPDFNGFDVLILPERSKKDHGNLDEFALQVVNEQCNPEN